LYQVVKLDPDPDFFEALYADKIKHFKYFQGSDEENLKAISLFYLMIKVTKKVLPIFI